MGVKAIVRQAAGLRGWTAVVRQSLVDLRAVHAAETAGAIAFYALLAFFPLLLGGVASASLVADPSWAVARLTTLLGEFLPAGTVEVQAIVDGSIAGRERIGVLAVVSWAVAGRRLLSTLVTAINRVSDVDELADPLRRRLLVELCLLLAIGLLFLLALSTAPVVELLWTRAGGLPGSRRLVVEVTTLLLRALLLLAAFATLYAVVPRGERGRQPVLVGAITATVLFLVVHAAFVMAMRWVWGNLSLVYGPLAVATVLLTWAWYVGMIVLFGASLASHAKVMRLEGQSAREAGQQHGG